MIPVLRVLALLGLGERIARVRSVVTEGAMAVEDRAQLLRLAWDEEKERLKRVVLLLLALVGLTLMMTSLLSIAVIVHFWETPHRALAAWLVALTWIALWLAAVWMLLATLKQTPPSATIAREQLGRDRAWLAQHFGDEDETPKARPATRQQLLDRIEQQRQRLALQQRMEAVAEEAPVPESTSEKATRIAREHPIVAGAAAAALLALVGPSRVARIAGWALPIWWKLR